MIRKNVIYNSEYYNNLRRKLESILESDEITLSDKQISLFEFRSIIENDFKKQRLEDKYVEIKNKFNELQYARGVLGINRKVNNPFIQSSKFEYSENKISMNIRIKQEGNAISIVSNKSGIENIEYLMYPKYYDYAHFFIESNLDNIQKLLFEIMEFADSYDSNLVYSKLISKKPDNKLNFNIDYFNWFLYEHNVDHFMLLPESGLIIKPIAENTEFLDGGYNPDLLAKENIENLEKRLTIDIDTLSPAYVKKILKK